MIFERGLDNIQKHMPNAVALEYGACNAPCSYAASYALQRYSNAIEVKQIMLNLGLRCARLFAD